AAETDPAVPVTGVAPLDKRISAALQRDRFNLLLAAGVLIVALLVAAIGIYAATAYAATARAREFGVRLALGASPGGLLRRPRSPAGRFLGGGRRRGVGARAH